MHTFVARDLNRVTKKTTTKIIMHSIYLSGEATKIMWQVCNSGVRKKTTAPMNLYLKMATKLDFAVLQLNWVTGSSVYALLLNTLESNLSFIRQTVR